MRSLTINTSSSLLCVIFISVLLGCTDSSVGNFVEGRLSPDQNLSNNYGLDNSSEMTVGRGGRSAITQMYWPPHIPSDLCYPGSELLAAKQLFGNGSAPFPLNISKNDEFDEVVLDAGDTFQTDWQVMNASPDQIYEFYRDFFSQNEWDVTRQPNELNNAGLFQGVKGGARITLRFEDIVSVQQMNAFVQDDDSIVRASPTGSSSLIEVERVGSEQLTRYTLAYRPKPIVGLSESVVLDSQPGFEPLQEDSANEVAVVDLALPLDVGEQIETRLESGETQVGSGGTSQVELIEREAPPSDIGQAPEELQRYVEDMVALSRTQEEVHVAIKGDTTFEDKGGASTFSPNVPISRREYARWLFTLNNVLYNDRPSQHIHLGNETDQPAFPDVLLTDPDFGVIQGLAEAGLISSSLTNSNTSVEFQPDVPVTREILVAWKTPLDLNGVPTATVEDLYGAWGFQDFEQIGSQFISEIVADSQNGDRSNIRRVFGYTLLFQPKKVVTRAEAAAALWHFGNEEDSVSIQDRL